ncbi:hypothetical protein ACWD2L_00545 [Streptomyces sp. NPDC002754]
MAVNPATGCGCTMCTGEIFNDEPVRAPRVPERPATDAEARGRPALRLVVDNTRR